MLLIMKPYVLFALSKLRTGETIMSQVVIIIALIIMGLTGGLSTLYIAISLPSIIIWKIYRR